MLKKFEYPIILFTGGVVYMLLETAWRGFTHWSMGICGGVCFLGIYLLERFRSTIPLPFKCLLGSVFITFNEFITGCIVNLWLGWNVWDYSHMMFDLLGQICVEFFLLWFLLCIPAFLLSRLLLNKVFMPSGYCKSAQRDV